MKTIAHDEHDPFADLIEPDHVPEFLKVLYADCRGQGILVMRDVINHREPDPMLARNFTRSVFAFIEGGVSVLRATALVALRDKLKPWQLAALSESTYQVDKDGTIKVRQEHKQFEQAFFLVSRVLYEQLGVDALLCKGDTRWQLIRQAKLIRDRLTHPRKLADLAITQEELHRIAAALVGFVTFFQRVLVETIEKRNAFDADLAAVEAFLNDLPGEEEELVE